MQSNELARVLDGRAMTAVAIGRAHEISARVGMSLLGALSYGASYARNLRATREWRRLAI